MTDISSFWMVLCDGSEYTRVRHNTKDRAVQEAKRLAAQTKGVKFFVLECIGAAVVEDPVRWIGTSSDDLTF